MKEGEVQGGEGGKHEVIRFAGIQNNMRKCCNDIVECDFVVRD